MAMTGQESFKHALAELCKARFPIIYVTTWEEERVAECIQELAEDASLIKTPRKVMRWSSTRGFHGPNTGAVKDSTAPLKAFEHIASFPEPGLFLFLDMHPRFGCNGRPPDFDVIRRLRDLVVELRTSPQPKTVIFISPTLQLPPELQKDVTVLDFDLPSVDELRAVLEQMIETNTKVAVDRKELPRLIEAALGLTQQEAENTFARAMARDGKLDKDDVDVVLEEKRQIIKKTGVLEFIRTDQRIENVGGLDNLKRWLEKRNDSWTEEARKYNLPAPRGVLITGIPGCGKSLLAKAMSAVWKLPLLKLDVGRIFSGLVGSSEQNMREAIRTAEAVSPSILWIDEIEKGFGGQSSAGDSGTSSRVFATFLTWMQEKTRPVFVIATANNIDRLPPEMLRKGRFDEIFFVGQPTWAERKDIFRIHIGARVTHPDVMGDVTAQDDDLIGQLATRTDGFVGAEIEHIVESALFDAFAEKRAIRREDLFRAIGNTEPLCRTQAEQIKAIREWARNRAVAASKPDVNGEGVHAEGMPSGPAGRQPVDL